MLPLNACKPTKQFAFLQLEHQVNHGLFSSETNSTCAAALYVLWRPLSHFVIMTLQTLIILIKMAMMWNMLLCYHQSCLNLLVCLWAVAGFDGNVPWGGEFRVALVKLLAPPCDNCCRTSLASASNFSMVISTSFSSPSMPSSIGVEPPFLCPPLPNILDTCWYWKCTNFTY